MARMTAKVKYWQKFLTYMCVEAVYLCGLQTNNTGRDQKAFEQWQILLPQFLLKSGSLFSIVKEYSKGQFTAAQMNQMTSSSVLSAENIWTKGAEMRTKMAKFVAEYKDALIHRLKKLPQATSDDVALCMKGIFFLLRPASSISPGMSSLGLS